MKKCIACGMPMEKVEDYAMGNINSDYCIHCANPDGTMQSYEEKLDNMTKFIIKTQGLNYEVAKNAAMNMMSKLPAWKEYFN